MDLTHRKKQFLQKLMDLYDKSGLPVHYETLANAIGVSKWTAYDMVKQLEKLGFLLKDYASNDRETGRSQIVFSPTEKAMHLLTNTYVNAIYKEEWESIKTELLLFVKKIKNPETTVTIKPLEELPAIQGNAAHCANDLCLLMVYLKDNNPMNVSFIKQLFEHIDEDCARLTLFIGTVIGNLNQNATEVMKLSTDLIKQINNLTADEQQLVSSFLSEAIAIE